MRPTPGDELEADLSGDRADKSASSPRLVHEETMCCGYKRCPRVQLFEDGSMVLDDEGQVIRLTPEQRGRLRELLA